MSGFFGLFDYNKPGPGVRKDEPEKKGVARYFDILGRRLWKMVALNFLYVVASIIPFVIMGTVFTLCVLAIMMLSGMSTEDIGVVMTENSGTLLLLFGALLVYAVNGGGAVSCGMVNVLRKYTEDTTAWVFQDFVSGVRDNFLRGTVAFIIDCFALAVLTLNYGIYNFTDIMGTDGVIITLLRALLLLVMLIWGMMHVYIYPTMTSFKFKLKDVYKNSFIMVIGKFLPSAGAFFLGFGISFAVVLLAMGFIYSALLIPVIMFAIVEYSKLYISYPMIKKYMRDPEEAKRAAKLDSLRRDIQSDDRVFSDKRVDPK